ncbi:MAG TPA: hypothetical protein VLX59_07930 [Acidimicrobiales bacterium]|nr:hypothetical protein [Acidimicrobiales bacterium]
MTDSDSSTAAPPAKRRRRGRTLALQIRQLIRAIDDGDDATVEAAVLQLSRSRRYLAPLALAVGAFVMLFQGLKLVFSEWRLTLVQVLPAMWIWAAMLDLKVHVLKGREFQIWRGPLAAVLILVIALISVAAFYLNAVFAFAIAGAGKPDLRSAFAQARRQIGVVAAFGFTVGVALGVSAIVVPRWGLRWFALSMSIVIGVMMLTYVAVPSRLVGLKSTYSGRDKLTATVVAGAFGAVVCAPGYAIGRTGILLLGSHRTFVFALGVVMLSMGFALQAGASGAVKAIKMSAKLAAGNLPAGGSNNGSAAPVAAGPSLSPGAIDADAAPGG